MVNESFKSSIYKEITDTTLHLRPTDYVLEQIDLHNNVSIIYSKLNF